MNKKSIPFFSCNTCKNERDLKIGKCPFDFKPNLNIPLRRNYNMHCLQCGYTLFLCPAEFIRVYSDKKPVCGECIADKSQAEHYQALEDQWLRNHPGVDFDQYQIDEANKLRYGEY